MLDVVGELQCWPNGQLGIWVWPTRPWIVACPTAHVAPLVFITIEVSPKYRISLGELWVTTARVLHPRSMLVIYYKSHLVVLINGSHKLGVLFKIAACRRDSVATVANPKISAAIHKGQVRSIESSGRRWSDWDYRLGSVIFQWTDMIGGDRLRKCIPDSYNTDDSFLFSGILVLRPTASVHWSSFLMISNIYVEDPVRTRPVELGSQKLLLGYSSKSDACWCECWGQRFQQRIRTESLCYIRHRTLTLGLIIFREILGSHWFLFEVLYLLVCRSNHDDGCVSPYQMLFHRGLRCSGAPMPVHVC